MLFRSLCDHIDGSLPGSPVPGILQARTLEWVACMKVKVKSLSHVRLFATPWTVAYKRGASSLGGDLSPTPASTKVQGHDCRKGSSDLFLHLSSGYVAVNTWRHVDMCSLVEHTFTPINAHPVIYTHFHTKYTPRFEVYSQA